MRLSFVWQDAKDKRTRCEQLALTAESQEDLESLSRLARLFACGLPAAEVARQLADSTRSGLPALTPEQAEAIRRAADGVTAHQPAPAG